MFSRISKDFLISKETTASEVNQHLSDLQNKGEIISYIKAFRNRRGVFFLKIMVPPVCTTVDIKVKL